MYLFNDVPGKLKRWSKRCNVADVFGNTEDMIFEDTRIYFINSLRYSVLGLPQGNVFTLLMFKMNTKSQPLRSLQNHFSIQNFDLEKYRLATKLASRHKRYLNIILQGM